MYSAGVLEDVFESLPAFGVAHPSTSNQFGSEAYKPGVEEVLARTRLASDRAVSQVGVLRYTFCDISYHDLGRLVSYVLGNYLLALRMLRCHIEHLLILVAYHLRNRGRFDPASVVRNRGVGRCHGEWRNLVRAEYYGRLGMFGEMRGDPASPCDVRDLLWSVFQATAASVHRQVCEHSVIRPPERLFEADLTPHDAVVVLYLPRLRFACADVDLVLLILRDVPGIGIDALLQGCDEGERLERATGLAPALGDEVELGALIPVADHSLYTAGTWLYGDEGEVVRRGEVSRRSVDNIVGGDLLLQVYGGVDAEVSFENGMHAVTPNELVMRVLGEVAGELRPCEPRLGRCVGGPGLRQWLLEGLVVVPARNIACVKHLGQYEVSLILCPIAVLSEDRRRPQEPDKGRRLRDAQILDRHVEVSFGGRLHPVGVVTEVDGIQVVGDDLVFRVLFALNLYGDESFFDLPGDRTVLREVGIPDILLGDGASTLDRLSGPDVDPESAHDPPEVDAAVLPEALVFFGDHGVEQVRRHLRKRSRLAVLAFDYGSDYAPRVLVAAERGRVYVGGMGLVGPLLIQLLHALYEPQVPARRERRPRDQHAHKKDAYAAQNPRGQAPLAGRSLAVLG